MTSHHCSSRGVRHSSKEPLMAPSPLPCTPPDIAAFFRANCDTCRRIARLCGVCADYLAAAEREIRRRQTEGQVAA